MCNVLSVLFPVKFHIAHLYEVQAKYKIAKDNYEQLLKEKALPVHLKADICRQLGKHSFLIHVHLLFYDPQPNLKEKDFVKYKN